MCSAACLDGHSSHTFWYGQFDCLQGCFIVSLSTGIAADLDVVSQYEIIRKAVLDSVLGIVGLRRSLEVD